MKTHIDREKAKKIVEKTATGTVKVTMTILKIIFVLIIAYTIIASLYFFLGTEDQGKWLIDNVVLVSVAGFWAFFLGYFGWRMGQTIENYLIHRWKK